MDYVYGLRDRTGKGFAQLYPRGAGTGTVQKFYFSGSLLWLTVPGDGSQGDLPVRKTARSEQVSAVTSLN